MSDTPPTLYCANHPQTPTTLRCNRCEKPICPKCAVQTPTGYRCKECVRGQQKVFSTTTWYDYITSSAIALILSFIGSQIVPLLGFFTIFLAPIAGMLIAEAVRLVVQRRRSKLLLQLATLATAIGSLLLAVINLMMILPVIAQGSMGLLLGLIWKGVYAFLVTSSVYYRLGGIRFRT